MSQKSDVAVRFHSETNPNDSEAFAIPIDLQYQRRKAYVCRAPDFSEKQIERILPFQAKDGSWGCVFKLNAQGRIRLETMSGEIRGSALVVFIVTKAGRRQVMDMIIDRPVSDGIITVPRGLNEIEILALAKQFKIIGAQEKKRGPETMKNKNGGLPSTLEGHRENRPSVLDPLPTSRSNSRSREFPEPALPRLSD